jgi:hypothetical protein
MNKENLILDIKKRAQLAADYLTAATDKKNNYMPYWYISIGENPPYARHCRVDDSELAGSWSESLHNIGNILGEHSNEQKEILGSWQDICLQGFRDCGLRYNIDYPWTQTIFANFHEQGWILSALVSMYKYSEDKKVYEQIEKMVKGLRNTVSEKKETTYWGGTYPQERKSYYFLQDGLYENGWDHSKWSGRGENELRSHVMVDPLMDWHILTGSETALDIPFMKAEELRITAFS